AAGAGAREASVRHDADAHRVHQRVGAVARGEVYLAANRGHAHAVAVVRDAGDDALEQVAVVGVVGRTEVQRVEHGDGPRAHGEHVAEDAADPGGRALEGLDGAGMVVRLDLHYHRQPI